MDTQRKYDVQQFKDLIRDIPFAMFTTVIADGTLRSRPMVATSESFDGALWFFSRVSSPLGQEIAGKAEVNITYVSAPEDRFVSVSGKAEVVKDVTRATQMWNPSYGAWFAGGPSDPELSLVKITVAKVEHWDRKLGRMQQL